MISPNALVIALGQPSDPLPHDGVMRGLAEDIQAILPGWTIRGATLESPESIAVAAADLQHPLIYPLLMAEGFFMSKILPNRLGKIMSGATLLPPLGADPAFPGLVVAVARQAARSAGYGLEQTSLLLAAHGSEVSPASRQSTEALATHVAQTGEFRSVVTGYIEEPPFIKDSARNLGQALCLPIFALRASHVSVDIPAALAAARFSGRLLDPLGMQPEIPAFIAAALQSAFLSAPGPPDRRPTRAL